jgi:broad specificity phosphatase PhoE
MVQIVLIRPGSTNYDEQGRIQGTLDIPLSAQGSAKAQQLGEELRQFDLTVIYTSPCQAAWQTGSAIGQARGIKVKQLDNLKNLDHGLWQGMQIDEIRRKHPKVFRQWQEQPEIICPPEGEMLAQAQERVKTALTKLLRKQKPGTIGLVVPEPLATLVNCFLTQTEIGEIWKLGASCGSWELIKLDSEPLIHRGLKIRDEKNGAQDGAVPIGLN